MIFGCTSDGRFLGMSTYSSKRILLLIFYRYTVYSIPGTSRVAHSVSSHLGPPTLGCGVHTTSTVDYIRTRVVGPKAIQYCRKESTTEQSIIMQLSSLVSLVLLAIVASTNAFAPAPRAFVPRSVTFMGDDAAGSPPFTGTVKWYEVRTIGL
jgi:hypothetical protein